MNRAWIALVWLAYCYLGGMCVAFSVDYAYRGWYGCCAVDIIFAVLCVIRACAIHRDLRGADARIH
jgi:hypothetical protein